MNRVLDKWPWLNIYNFYENMEPNVTAYRSLFQESMAINKEPNHCFFSNDKSINRILYG